MPSSLEVTQRKGLKDQETEPYEDETNYRDGTVDERRPEEADPEKNKGNERRKDEPSKVFRSQSNYTYHVKNLIDRQKQFRN